MHRGYDPDSPGLQKKADFPGDKDEQKRVGPNVNWKNGDFVKFKAIKSNGIIYAIKARILTVEWTNPAGDVITIDLGYELTDWPNGVDDKKVSNGVLVSADDKTDGLRKVQLNTRTYEIQICLTP